MTESPSGLPRDLAAKLPRRVREVCRNYSAIFAMAAGTEYAIEKLTGRAPFGAPLLMSSLFITAGLLCWAAARRTRSVPSLLNIGTVMSVVGAFGIEFTESSVPLPDNAFPAGVSWVTLWIYGFASYVPGTPKRTAVNAFAAAAASAVALAIALATGYAAPRDGGQFAAVILPNFLVAGLAIPTTRVLYELGKELTRIRQLGSYHLVERIGAGGMGEVWRATHGILKRPAAVKLIQPHALAGDSKHRLELLRRFRREAEVTASLHSPHTVELYDFGVDDDGTLYYVMELLEGVDLSALVDRDGPQPAARVAHILAQVCDALAEAHDAGLVHRDIKLANIFLCRQAARLDFAKVLDFGLVKKLDQPDLSTTGHDARGTPAVMAPELILGGNVDARTDLYALGCVAYTLLTGRPVFVEPSSALVMMRHAQATPAPLSDHVEVPAELEQLVLSCLAKAPEQRPASARAMLTVLEPLANEWTSVAAQARWQRHDAAATISP